MNTALKMAIFESGLSQVVIARRIGMAEAILSRIVRGHTDPTAEQQAALAAVLGKRVDDLFGRSEPVSP